MKTKNIITVILVMIITITCLTGCGAKLISTESETVEVVIVDEYHRSMWIQPVNSGSVKTFITHPARYEIMVEYNGVEYVIDDAATYGRYNEKIGQTVTGILQIRTYEDGSVKYDVISLK